MQIQIDSREKQRAIRKIVADFDKMGVQHFTSKLYVGDYQNLDNPRVIVDRKQNLSEVYANVCHGHKRFIAELLRAKEAGIRLVILCEHGGKIRTLDDVKNWENPQLRKSPYAWDGRRLYKTLCTISRKYDTDFLFCDKRRTARKIVELLGGLS
nr:MAG TPA: ERCC4 domain protein [Caudoviricetes sp.]